VLKLLSSLLHEKTSITGFSAVVIICIAIPGNKLLCLMFYILRPEIQMILKSAKKIGGESHT
jgi:hypothetical protein